MKRIRKPFARLLGALLLCGLSTGSFAGVLKKPYLLYEGQNTTMTVLWQDDAVETTNTLSWGTDTGYGAGSATVPESGPDHQHRYQISGLRPGTRYYYRVADGATVYGMGSFLTAPDENARSAKFLAFGDTRSTPLVLEAVVREMRKVYAADPAFQGLSIHSGDWVSSDAESAWTSQWFNRNPETVRFLAEQPVSGVKGNHENVSGFSKYFPKYYPFPYARPGRNPRDPQALNNLYWSFDYGPVHFTVVDQYSPYAPGSAQYEWVVKDLATTSKPWKILIFHEPPWSAGTHPNNVETQEVFDPLIRKYGVDVVYSGHNHYYARAQFVEGDRTSVPGRPDSIVPGVVYLTNGGGGAPPSEVDLSNEGRYRHVRTGLSEHGYMTFEVDDRSLVLKAYAVYQDDGDPASRVRLSGSVRNVGTKSVLIDTVTLRHRGAAVGQ
ncbi:MAG: metallophosphoesterase family protein [Deltaproteobacteria bacterium]|nr:metallophosphoesterase family protein [Deltaproteobacteria bacterium]